MAGLTIVSGKQTKHKLTLDFIVENKANENYNNKIKFLRPFFWLFLDFLRQNFLRHRKEPVKKGCQQR
jgi:hypothetical protein